MAGIFCLIAPADDPRVELAATRLAEGMCLFPHQTAHVLSLTGGRVHLGVVLNDEARDGRERFLVQQGDRACAVEGHIARSRCDCGAASPLTARRYAGAVLAAHAKFGSAFAEHLEGQYNAIVLDEAGHVVLAGNGRHAQSPLYYYSRAGWTVLATSLGPLGACGVFRPRIASRSLQEFLCFGQYFGSSTPLEDVEVLDGASTCSFSLESLQPSCRQYWDYGRIGPKRRGYSFSETADDLCDLFQVAADRMVARPGPLVSGLSGGNDSRLVTGLAARRVTDLKAWTFGVEGSADLRVASAICAVLGLEHIRFGLDPAAMLENATDYVSSVDGSMTVAHAYIIPRARRLGEIARVVLNGYGGDYLLQGGLLDLGPAAWVALAEYRLRRRDPVPHPHLEGNLDRAGVVRYLAAKYGRPSALATLLRPSAPTFPEIAERELERQQGRVPHEYLVEQWGFENRGRRWTVLGMVADRHFYGDDCVYYDDDLFDRCLATPNTMRRGNRLHNYVVKRLIPEIADMESSNTGLPATTPAWRIMARKLARRALRLRGGRAPGYSTGVDVDLWTRGPQRAFYTELLTDAATRGRSWWDGNALRELGELHFAGACRCGKELGLVATAELFARRWVDPFASTPVILEEARTP